MKRNRNSGIGDGLGRKKQSRLQKCFASKTRLTNICSEAGDTMKYIKTIKRCFLLREIFQSPNLHLNGCLSTTLPFSDLTSNPATSLKRKNKFYYGQGVAENMLRVFF